MAVTINADTSNGLVMTPDTSGEIKLQSAGADIVSVTANGMAVDTNTLYVDATNNSVGIGTSSPSSLGNLVVSAVTDPVIALEDQGAWNASIKVIGASGALTFNNAANTERMRINSSGALLIGTTSYSSSSNGTAIGGNNLSSTSNDGFNISLNKASGAPQPTYIFMAYNNGLVGYINYNGAGGVNYNSSSDYRLKENNVNITDGITRVKLLKPYRFNFIAHPDKTVSGFFAHEVQDIVPEAVDGTKDAVDDEGNPVYQGIDQSKLVPLLTSALQEAITKIEDLETRIQALENA